MEGKGYFEQDEEELAGLPWNNPPAESKEYEDAIKERQEARQEAMELHRAQKSAEVEGQPVPPDTGDDPEPGEDEDEDED